MTVEEGRDILRLDGTDNDHIITPLIEAIPPYLKETTGYSVQREKYSPVARTAARFILQLWYYAQLPEPKCQKSLRYKALKCFCMLFVVVHFSVFDMQQSLCYNAAEFVDIAGFLE